jgi:hypothetical protein
VVLAPLGKAALLVVTWYRDISGLRREKSVCITGFANIRPAQVALALLCLQSESQSDVKAALSQQGANICQCHDIIVCLLHHMPMISYAICNYNIMKMFMMSYHGIMHGISES